MNKNVYMNYANRSVTPKDNLGRFVDKDTGFKPKEERKIEFGSEKRKRLSSEIKERFGFSHGGTNTHKKNKKKR